MVFSNTIPMKKSGNQKKLIKSINTMNVIYMGLTLSILSGLFFVKSVGKKRYSQNILHSKCIPSHHMYSVNYISDIAHSHYI